MGFQNLEKQRRWDVEHAVKENSGAFGLNFQFDWILYFEDCIPVAGNIVGAFYHKL